MSEEKKNTFGISEERLNDFSKEELVNYCLVLQEYVGEKRDIDADRFQSIRSKCMRFCKSLMNSTEEWNSLDGKIVCDVLEYGLEMVLRLEGTGKDE